MKKIYGICACPGTAEGTVIHYEKNKFVPEIVESWSGPDEIARLSKAGEEAIRHVGILSEKALQVAGRGVALIFESHAMMIGEMRDAIKKVIMEKRVSVWEAAVQVSSRLAGQMEAMEDSYMKARAADIKETVGYLLSALWRMQYGESQGDPVERQGIWFMDVVTPEDIVEFGKISALAFVTAQDMKYTHAAVVADAYGIPVIGGIPYQPGWDGCFAELDAGAGVLLVKNAEGS